MNISTLKFKFFAFNIFIVTLLSISMILFTTFRVKRFFIEERIESRSMVNNQAAFVALATVLGAGGHQTDYLSEFLSEYEDLVYCVTISAFSTYYKDGLCFIENEEVARKVEDLCSLRPNNTEVYEREGMLNIMSPVHRINDEGKQEIAGYLLSGFSLQSIDDRVKGIYFAIIVNCLAIFIFGTLLSYFMTSIFLKPLNKATEIITYVANGDFTRSVSEKSKSEIGKLIGTINTMVSSWRLSIETMKEVINKTDMVAETMSEATQHQENVTSEQASAVNEVTSTIVELNTSSKQVCEKAEQASKSSQGVLKIASDGQKAVEKSMGEVNTIQNKVRTISGQALNLSLEAQQIGSIVKSVSEIANKTDMLAINAGIEAARAGENGKGFSIVASEVRNLADQSKKSAEKIAMLIESIQSATNSTVLATEDAIKSVQVGMKFIVEVGQSIDQLMKNTQEAVNYASEIVLASKQQSLGTDQVSSVMSNINEGMRTTAVSAVQILEEAKTLKKMSSDLSDVASKYKI